MYQRLLQFRYTRERKHMFSAMIFWWFGVGILQIFITIYLFQSGFSLAAIFLFAAMQQGVRTISVPLALVATGKIGAKHVLSISLVFPIAFYLFFSAIINVPMFFYFAAIMLGLAQGYGWVGYHMHMSKVTPDTSRGRTLGTIMVIQMLGLAAGPVLGGILIERFGIVSALMTSIAIFLATIVILLSSREVSVRHTINLKLLHLRKVLRDAIGNGFYNTKTELNILAWPIFMFIVVQGYEKLGYIEGSALIVGMIAVALIGKLLDRTRRKLVLLWTSIVYAIVSALSVFAGSVLAIAIMNILMRAAGRANNLPWLSIFHSNLGKHPRTEYLLWFEGFGAGITALFMFAFIFIAQVLDVRTTLIIAILVSSVSVLVPNIVRYREGDYLNHRESAQNL